MKWLILLLGIPGVAVACPKGTEPYLDTCVVEILPQSAPPVKPSDEKPPKDKMPSYERAGIKVIEAPYMGFEDGKRDQEKAAADAEGKKSAGIPGTPTSTHP